MTSLWPYLNGAVQIRVGLELAELFMYVIRADFREWDEDSNFSIFRVQRFSEWPEPLHWIAFPVEILTKPLIHWIASPLFTENPFFHTEKCFVASPSTKNRLNIVMFSKGLVILRTSIAQNKRDACNCFDH